MRIKLATAAFSLPFIFDQPEDDLDNDFIQNKLVPLFRKLKKLADAHSLKELSMGMTQDFEVAVEEGATIVRVGSAIFA